MKVKGAVAMITGAASGIGYAFCRELLKQGAASVAMVDIDKKAGIHAQDCLQAECGSGSAKFIECDVTKNEDLKEAMNHVINTNGKLDILCNNAGISVEEDWEKVIHVNLVGVIHGTKLGLELMSSGLIVNTSSVSAITCERAFPVYSATKSGIMAFTRATAPVAMETKGIRVNCVCPTAVDTPSFRKGIEKLPTAERNRIEALIKSGQFQILKPEVIAKGLIQVIADDSKNGEALVILGEDKSGYHLFNELGVFKPNM